MKIPDARGTYFCNGAFIALRDDTETTWRVSRIESNDGKTLTMTYIATYQHQWQAIEAMTTNLQT